MSVGSAVWQGVFEAVWNLLLVAALRHTFAKTQVAASSNSRCSEYLLPKKSKQHCHLSTVSDFLAWGARLMSQLTAADCKEFQVPPCLLFDGCDRRKG